MVETLDDIEIQLNAELRKATDSKKKLEIENDLKRIDILRKQQKIVDAEMKKATSTKYTFGRDENEPEIDENALENAKTELEAETIINDAKKKKKKKKEQEAQKFNELPDEFADLKTEVKNQKELAEEAREKGGHDRGPRTR